MAATTTSNATRASGFDFAALSASEGRQDGGDEVARLRAALETLAELVVAHGVMDARTLESIVGDLIRPPIVPVALSAPLPPPAPSAEAVLKAGLPKPSPVAAKPPAVVSRPVAAAKPAPAPAPVPVAVAAPNAPTKIMAAPAAFAAEDVVVPPPAVAPVVASPFPAASEPEAAARRNPFAAPVDAARVAAELDEAAPPPALKPHGFFARLFGRGKASPAAVAKSAASIEFTERMPKMPVDGLYSEQQRATELSFPPTQPPRKTRSAAAPATARKKAPRPADAAPTRFCDRCWRRLEADGACKTCSAR
jgi:hypothetical protein